VSTRGAAAGERTDIFGSREERTSRASSRSSSASGASSEVGRSYHDVVDDVRGTSPRSDASWPAASALLSDNDKETWRNLCVATAFVRGQRKYRPKKLECSRSADRRPIFFLRFLAYYSAKPSRVNLFSVFQNLGVLPRQIHANFTH